MQQMDSVPPRLDEPQPVNRPRWWIHLVLITSYVLIIAVLGLTRDKTRPPALSHTALGLLRVCGWELLLFGFVLVLALLSSRASVDDLLLRWRGKGLPVLYGAAYSIGLRVGLGIVAAILSMALLATGVMTPQSLKDFAAKNRPGIEKAVDVDALRDNPAYFWLTLTIVSFVVAGLREELWRSSFLAGMRTLWPRHFGSTMGQVCAVIVCALIFGFAHAAMGVLAAVFAGLLGLGLGLIMVFHRSIWPAVFAHGFFDATSMALIPQVMKVLQHLPK